MSELLISPLLEELGIQAHRAYMQGSRVITLRPAEYDQAVSDLARFVTLVSGDEIDAETQALEAAEALEPTFRYMGIEFRREPDNVHLR